MAATPAARRDAAAPLTADEVERIRAEVPALAREVHGHRLTYLDSSNSSLTPRPVLDAMHHYYTECRTNVHRGVYTTGEEATALYETARAKVARFIGATDPAETIFSSGTTGAINMVANAWGRRRLGAGDEIVLTTAEHHSNLVPWQIVARETGAVVRYLPWTDDGRLDIDRLEDVVGERTKIVAFTGMSNVFGTIPPHEPVVARAREVGALTLMDGAQLVPHAPVDVTALGVDLLAFSAHKMLGPTGIGVLWGRRDLLETIEPIIGGGEMIRDVTLEGATWNDLPWRFEAGTPPIAEAIGLGAAVDYLEAIGMERVAAHEHALAEHALAVLAGVGGLRLFGPRDAADRGAAFSFELAGVHPHDIASVLDHEGIAVRAGHHCTKPLHRVLGVPSTARASFYVYNTPDEIDRLGVALDRARELFA